MGAIRVVVVDDDPMARAGIKMLLKPEEDIDVVAEAVDGQDAVTQARDQRPDVMLMDVRMPGIDGVTAIRTVIDESLTTQSEKPIKIIILTAYDDESVYAALDAGASGFLLKHASPIEITAAIRAVVAGGVWLDPKVTQRIIRKANTRPAQRTVTPTEMASLTPREREVLIHVARGLSNVEVAAELNITVLTVRTHLARLMAKLNVQEKAQAVTAAYQAGLLQANP
jgi:DNA-binding NarL/FixJ family response regulator